jgi:hypothetical protein
MNEYVGKCRICGADYNVLQHNIWNRIKKIMFREHICCACAVWMTRKKDPKATEEVIDGVLYNIYKGRRKGCRYSIDSMVERYVMKLDDMSVYVANRVVMVGRPPGNVEMKDTATFITKHEWSALSEGLFECQGTTCLDRYTCLFYFKDKVEGDRPANSVPKGWKDGDENCKSYLNINNLNKHLMKWRRKKQ